MEVLTILEWLLAWGMLLFAQSVFVNGVYQSSTGETKKRVDGTDEDSEMILYKLKKELIKQQPVDIFYRDGFLVHKLKILSNRLNWTSEYNIKDNKVFVPNSLLHSMIDWRERISADFGVEFYTNFTDGYFEVYTTESKYVYSKWIRKPLIECIKCMSSFWGALTFWPVVLFIFGFHWLEIPIFFADVFSLTYLNWILYKKAQ